MTYWRMINTFHDQLLSAFRDKPILSNDNYISSVNPGLTVPIVLAYRYVVRKFPGNVTFSGCWKSCMHCI